MWDDDISWQYHQDSRDAAVSDGAIALGGLILAIAIVAAMAFIIG